jgi:transposase-like protein
MARHSSIIEPINCPSCNSQDVHKAGIIDERQRYRCKSCSKYFFAENKRKRRLGAEARIAALMYIAGATNKSIQEALEASYALTSKWLQGADEYISSEPEIARLKKTGKRDVSLVNSLSEIPKKPQKNWLVIELDDDVFDGKSVVIRHVLAEKAE